MPVNQTVSASYRLDSGATWTAAAEMTTFAGDSWVNRQY